MALTTRWLRVFGSRLPAPARCGWWLRRIARFAVGTPEALTSHGAHIGAHRAMALAVRSSVAHAAMRPCSAPWRIQSGGSFAVMRTKGAGHIRQRQAVHARATMLPEARCSDASY